MDNKELIRRLMNFDDEEGIDSSTGYNSVSGRNDVPGTEVLCTQLSKYMEIWDDYGRKDKYGLELIDYYVYDEDSNTLILNDEDFNGINTGYSKCFNVGVTVTDPGAVWNICRRYGGMKIEFPRLNVESKNCSDAEKFISDVVVGFTSRTGTGHRDKHYIDLGLVRCQNVIPIIDTSEKFKAVTVSLYLDDDYDFSKPIVIGGTPQNPLSENMAWNRLTYKLAIDASLVNKEFPEGLKTMEDFFGTENGFNYKGQPFAPSPEIAKRWNFAMPGRDDRGRDLLPINIDIIVRNADIHSLDIDNNISSWRDEPVGLLDDKNDVGYNWWKDKFGINLKLEDSTVHVLGYDRENTDLVSVDGYKNIDRLYGNSHNERMFGGLTPTRAKSLIRDTNRRMKLPKQVSVR